MYSNCITGYFHKVQISQMLNFCLSRNVHDLEICKPNTRINTHDQHLDLQVFSSPCYATTTSVVSRAR